MRRWNGKLLKTVDDLLMADMTFGVLRDSAAARDLRQPNSYLHRRLWSRIVTFWPTTVVDSAEEGLQRARTERYAFIIDTPLGEYHAGRRPCDLHTIEPFGTIRSYAFGLSRTGPIRVDLVNTHLRLMHDTQILQTLYLKWWRDQCTHQRYPQPFPNRPSSVGAQSTINMQLRSQTANSFSTVPNAFSGSVTIFSYNEKLLLYSCSLVHIVICLLFYLF